MRSPGEPLCTASASLSREKISGRPRGRGVRQTLGVTTIHEESWRTSVYSFCFSFKRRFFWPSERTGRSPNSRSDDNPGGVLENLCVQLLLLFQEKIFLAVREDGAFAKLSE